MYHSLRDYRHLHLRDFHLYLGAFHLHLGDFHLHMGDYRSTIISTLSISQSKARADQ